MPVPYRARLDERAFLNDPGFHGRAYVIAYVEDTSERELETYEWERRPVPPTSVRRLNRRLPLLRIR